MLKRVVLVLILFFVPEAAYVARFPNLIEKRFEVPSSILAEFREIAGITKEDFGKTLRCPLGEPMATASVVAKKGRFDFGHDKVPTLFNEISISVEGQVVMIGPYWLDKKTGSPRDPGPRYLAMSPPLSVITNDPLSCWLRFDAYLQKNQTHEITLSASRSFWKSFFGSPQTKIRIHRTAGERDGVLLLEIGPDE